MRKGKSVQDLLLQFQARDRAEKIMDILNGESPGKGRTFLEIICETIGVEPSPSRLKNAMVRYAGTLSDEECKDLTDGGPEPTPKLLDVVTRISSMQLLHGTAAIIESDYRLKAVMEALKARVAPTIPTPFEGLINASGGNASDVERAVASYLNRMDDAEVNHLLADIKNFGNEQYEYFHDEVCNIVKESKKRSL